MRDQLIRYLMDELGPDERRAVDDKLARSEQLRRELAYLQSCLLPADDAACTHADEPPRGLAERTVGIIADNENGNRRLIPSRSAAYATAVDALTETPRWSLADLTVAGGVFLAISMLFLPAVRESRDAARRTQCANNLNQLGNALTQYTLQNRHFFPMIGRNDTAGVFAVYLLEEDLADKNELSRLLVCRSSPLGDQVATGKVVLRLPKTMAELRSLEDHERDAVYAQIGGTVASAIGYVEGGKYHAIKNKHSCRKAMLSDAPNIDEHGRQTLNHCGGQNVWFQDGSVRFITSAMLPVNDHLFLNAEQKAAAGCSEHDTVLGDSGTTPGAVPWTTVPAGDGN